jgi:nickel-type superoxide dismutase maturation protease
MMRALRQLAAAALAGVALARLLRSRSLWPLSRYVVEGPSMLPAYRHGERLLVNRLAYVLRPPAPGDVVVIRDPERPDRYLLKRIVWARGDRCFVAGDNAAESRDSRQFGAVARRHIIGKAWRRY